MECTVPGGGKKSCHPHHLSPQGHHEQSLDNHDDAMVFVDFPAVFYVEFSDQDQDSFQLFRIDVAAKWALSPVMRRVSLLHLQGL